MGRVQDDEPVDHLGVVHGGRPGDRSAPVVTDQPRGLRTKVFDQAANVGGEQVDSVGLEALWLRRQVVATRVGGDHAKTRRREGRDLQPPAKPELWEAVQQNDQRPIPGLDVMQVHVTHLGVTLPKLDPDVREQAGGGHRHTSLGGDVGASRMPAGLDRQTIQSVAVSTARKKRLARA
jgi:hypothetical protein